ncbi:Serine/threonine-protein phosphatase 7 long form homolog, partial [Linum perenne]
ITGLQVDGEAITKPIPSQWGELFRSLLGTSPPDSSLGTLKNSWLKENFSWLSPDADERTVEQYTRAYILSMFGQFMFCERTGSVVHAYYLTVLHDWEAASRFSWGSAVLSVLYREMSKAVLGINATSSPRGDLGLGHHCTDLEVQEDVISGTISTRPIRVIWPLRVAVRFPIMVPVSQ